MSATNPPSPLEGRNDRLVLLGVIDPASTISKFEQQLVMTASAENQSQGFIIDPTTLTDSSGGEFLTEPVGGNEPVENGEDPVATPNQIYLPMIVTASSSVTANGKGQPANIDEAVAESGVAEAAQFNRIFLPVIASNGQ